MSLTNGQEANIEPHWAQRSRTGKETPYTSPEHARDHQHQTRMLTGRKCTISNSIAEILINSNSQQVRSMLEACVFLARFELGECAT
jgi:hypothetical protein